MKEHESSIFEINVFADQYQIQMQDSLAECDYPETWNDDLIEMLFSQGERIIGIGTARDQDVDVELELFHDAMDEDEIDKEIDTESYDQVVQCNLDVPSGYIIFTGCTSDYEPSGKIQVFAKQYGLRIFWQDLDTVDEIGFEGKDKYLIKAWPNTYFEPKLLKAWKHFGNYSLAERN